MGGGSGSGSSGPLPVRRSPTQTPTTMATNEFEGTDGIHITTSGASHATWLKIENGGGGNVTPRMGFLTTNPNDPAFSAESGDLRMTFGADGFRITRISTGVDILSVA